MSGRTRAELAARSIHAAWLIAQVDRRRLRLEIPDDAAGTATCAHCTAAFEYDAARPGRKPDYCSKRCRQRAWRRAHRGLAGAGETRKGRCSWSG